jgi:hypothetical protein
LEDELIVESLRISSLLAGVSYVDAEEGEVPEAAARAHEGQGVARL